METKDKIELALAYLQVLQEGKVRPNRRGPGVVRDAKHNIPEIEAVKDEISRLFDLDLSKIETLRDSINDNNNYLDE